jgi:hypothetical protein
MHQTVSYARPGPAHRARERPHRTTAIEASRALRSQAGCRVARAQFTSAMIGLPLA